MTASAPRLSKVSIDPASLAPANAEVEHERQLALYDLMEENSFAPVDGGAGPFSLSLALIDSRLALEITGPDYQRTLGLSLNPLRGVIRDYQLICDSYYEAVRGASAAQIEAVDMGRRGLHNEGAELLRQRLDGKVEMDQETSRRLFTLVSALCRR